MHSSPFEPGLNNVRVDTSDPANSDYIVGANFVAGVTDPVTVDFNSSCCVRSSNLVAIDQAGNSASCLVDLGPLGSSNYKATYN